MIRTLACAAFVLGLFSLVPAHADDAAFLRSLDGNWVGKGKVKVRIAAPTISVGCKFNSTSTAQTLSLSGVCRGLLVFSRKIGADLKLHEGHYRGTYIGAGTGPAALSGTRTGNTINLDIRWASNVNGDRDANMMVEKIGKSGMRLVTTDKDLKTGRTVVTSHIDLQRQ